MVARTTLYAVLWALVLSHTVLNRALTQITLIDDLPRTERALPPSDADQTHAEPHADSLAPLSAAPEQINSTQLNNGTQSGNLTALCVRCVPGEYSTANCTHSRQSTSALPLEARCTAGYCMLPLNCSRCPLGTYNDQYNATACLACAPGSYADRSGALNCSTCRAGSYAARGGSVRCDSCGQGYYNPDRGSTARAACRTCSAGTYCPDAETRVPVPCQAGWYCPATALPGPVPCPAGHYCPRAQLTEPEPCPPGYYCPREGLIAAQPCPLNHYCLAGAVAPEPCSFLFAAPVQQTECSPTVLFYVVLVLGGVFAVLFVLWITIRAVRRVRASAESKRRTEYTKLIPEPIDGPRYNGL